MKFSIFINQKLFQEIAPEIGIKDAAILGYIQGLCESSSKKVLRKVISAESDGELYTWINYRHLLKEMPMLGYKSTASVSYAITRLEEAGFVIGIQENITNRKFICLTEKVDLLEWNGGVELSEEG
ncbi:hypothetical protein HOD30_00080 [Candidatus Peregrinibacteria bacterium]|jgi:hypothetical protein|nr:hypothetical protein [Candidatus Peregrinibacteria bacterium]MBT4632399.1 hypothetical protein [Candidatus Peregrinibacteria bacterium]MBT5517040.1 hypothetical protein [Candidatus Peregrinibacteria bacterium]MBT5823603.1 hypothetical protein [Candidatus Peregrinibacteria bacterium]